ncbi:type II toxin-antitoxin system PemK/MazF family toxin (plasmid) [Lactobacillus johnsonii]|uniref:Type II toxin-antitoxin system PemK/MazF family toxin n=1 Tax=Lactobacillus johnsonii TaxID=33959 RepID=A0A9X7T7X3_LACJH|nr:type II toxin-antitoxin system PemK/MazF family toxin [Lactobacillus johnsonii]
MKAYPKQGDFVFMDAEPHAGHEIGGHDPENQNDRRPYLVLSKEAFNYKTGLVHAMAISSKVKESPFRERIIDFESGINGDLLLTQIPEYDFEARRGEIVGHIKDQGKLDRVLAVFLSEFR